MVKTSPVILLLTVLVVGRANKKRNRGSARCRGRDCHRPLARVDAKSRRQAAATLERALGFGELTYFDVVYHGC